MKILQVTGLAGPGPIAGGVWQVARVQSQGLREAGHQVRLLAGWLGENPPRLVDGTVVETIRVRPPFPRANLRFLWSPSAVLRLRSAISWADVVHLHLCRDFMTSFALHLAVAEGKPIVAQSHGMLAVTESPVLRLFDSAVFRNNLRKIAVHLALTSQEEGELGAFGVSAPVVRVDNAVLAPAQSWVPGNRVNFLFAGRLHARKQPLVFAEAACILSNAGKVAHYTVAGSDQGQLTTLERQLAASGLTENFSILGPLDHNQLLSTMAAGAILVLPSLNEPYPMVALEGAALGMPMILTAESGISNLMRDNGAALVVPPDSESLATAMAMVATDPDLQLRLGLAARAVFEQRWTVQELTTVLSRVYADAKQTVRRSTA